jgi:hypothetical protein
VFLRVGAETSVLQAARAADTEGDEESEDNEALPSDDFYR